MENDEKTEVKIRELAAEMEKAGKAGAMLRIGATALIVCDNAERKTPLGSDMVPSFFVTKIHNGSVIKEEFI